MNKLKIHFFLTLIFTLVLNVAKSQDINSGLIAKYEFNGNANDTGKNGLHAFANATLATDRNGLANSCYYFNGRTDFIDLPNSSLLKPELPVSISFWVNFTTLKPGVLTTDFAQDIHTGAWVSLSSEGKLAFNFGDAGSTTSSSRRTKIGETVLETGVWYHIHGVVRGAMDMDIYINGINDCGTYTGSGNTLTYSNSTGSIGRKDSNPSQPPHYFHGYIDEFYYWNRTVNIEEILNIEPIASITNIISFKVPGQTEPTIIDSLNHTINITIECENSFNLKPNFSLSNNSIVYVNGIKQISEETENNFSNDVIYTVINSNNCSHLSTDWKVMINKQEISGTESDELTSFSTIEIQDQLGLIEIDSIYNLITLTIKCEANINNLNLNFSIAENTLFLVNDDEYLSGNSFNFSVPLDITLVNKNYCSEKKWTIIANQKTYTEHDILYNQSFLIPNIITPNQDGKNEYFKVGELLVRSPLIIVNRYGIPVFESDSYQNNFNGSNLSSGVYYYAIEYSCYSELIKGTLTILH